MIKKYNDFINEQLSVFGDMKNLAGKFLYNTSDNFKKPIEVLINQFNTSKEADNIKKQYINYLKNNIDSLKKLLVEKEDITDIKTIIKDNISTMYISLQSYINFINQFEDDDKKKIKMIEIFKDSDEYIKKLFIDDSKIFNKNIESFTNELIQQLAKPFKINVNIDNEKNKEAQEIIKTTNNNLNNEESQIKEINENLIKFKDNIIKWFDFKLYKPIKNYLNE